MAILRMLLLIVCLKGQLRAAEDRPTIAEALNVVEPTDKALAALGVFQQVRMERSYQMQPASMLNGKIWHFSRAAAKGRVDAR